MDFNILTFPGFSGMNLLMCSVGGGFLGAGSRMLLDKAPRKWLNVLMVVLGFGLFLVGMMRPGF
jgi:hypothetical protein